MKRFILLLALLFSFTIFAQKTKVDIIRWKPMTSVERDALSLQPGDRWEIYNTTTDQKEKWNGTAWVSLEGSGGTPSGSDTELQFNNAGVFGASSDLTFDDSTNTIQLGGIGQIKSYTSHVGYEAVSGNNIRLTTYGAGNHIGVNHGNSSVSSIYLGADSSSKDAVFMLRGGDAANAIDATEYVRFEQTGGGLNIDLFKGFYWVNGGAFLFNTDQGNHDFRVYGQTDQYLIRADVSSDNVGIGFSVPSEKLDVDGNVKADQYKLSALNTAPSSATDTGTTGEIRVTSDYIYVCIATNTWVRAALSTW